MMIWVQFAATALAIGFVSVKMTEYSDVIAIRTRLGGVMVGTLLLAAVTSLPEFLTNITSVRMGEPNLAAGGTFGSSMFNMLLLGVLDLLFWKTRILRRVALRHALTGALAIMIHAMMAFFILADVQITVGWIGLDSLLVIAMYFLGIWVLQRENPSAPQTEEIPESEGLASLPRAILGFIATSAVLIVVTPIMVRSAVGIAAVTGLGTGFVGTLLVGAVVSMTEIVSSITAVRLGAYDLAVGNLFGSNVFNIFVLAVTDFFATEGRLLGAIDPNLALVCLLSLLMTALGLINNLARVERRILFVEVDAALLIIVYFAGLYFLYARGIG